jgi:hypothetical protein
VLDLYLLQIHGCLPGSSSEYTFYFC